MSVIELPDDREKAESWANFSEVALNWLDEQRTLSDYVKNRAQKLIEKTGSRHEAEASRAGREGLCGPEVR